MNILSFPDEIICEMYSHMSRSQRLALRSTCKQFYCIFKVDVSKAKIQEWKNKILTLMGLSMVEKLVTHQLIRFEYKLPVKNGANWNFRTGYETEHVTFVIDSNAPGYDNVRFCFLFVYDRPEFKEYHTMIESTNTFTTDLFSVAVSSLFRFKDAPKNQLSSENVQFLSQIMVDMFFKFITKPQYKSPDAIKNHRVSDLLEEIIDRPKQTKIKVFSLFDNSNFIRLPYSVQPSGVQHGNAATTPQRTFIYQDKVSEMIDQLRSEIKPYFYDGKDAKYCML